jgi:hypothetical protein
MKVRYSLTVFAAVAAIALTGCGPGPVVTKPNDVQSSVEPSYTETQEPEASPTSPVAKVGNSITLKGTDVDAGVTLTVTVVKVVPVTKSSDGYSTPEAGNRYAAVQFRIVNTGDTTYSGYPAGSTKVVDGADQQFDPATLVDSTAGPSLPADVKLAPGGKVLGYVTYELPKTSKIVIVQYSIDSYLGATGEWKV